MPKDHNQKMEEKLEAIVELLQNLLAIELFMSGASQAVICKRLHITNAKVVTMLQGIKKEK